MKNKIDRIKFLKDICKLNTPEYHIVRPGNELDILDAFEKIWGEKVSLRTYIEGEEGKKVTPHLPNIYKIDARMNIHEWFVTHPEYTIIVSEGIDPNFSEISAISHVTQDKIVTEYIEGPGTVRRLAHGGAIPRSHTYDRVQGSKILDPRIRSAIIQIHSVDCVNLLFEWSWYHIPVGWKKENLIFWEFMKNGSGESYIKGRKVE